MECFGADLGVNADPARFKKQGRRNRKVIRETTLWGFVVVIEKGIERARERNVRTSTLSGVTQSLGVCMYLIPQVRTRNWWSVEIILKF